MKPTTGIRIFVLAFMAILTAGCGGDLLSAPPGVKGAVAITVTGLAATVSETTATITWTTEEPTTHLVEYGTVSGTYSYATTQSQSAELAHTVSLTGLTESTAYFYRVTSFDQTLSASVSTEGSFATLSYPGIQVTDLAATASQTTAVVTWSTDVPTTHVVEYGTATGLYELSTTQSQTPSTTHSVSLSGLTASITYYYRIRNFHATMPATVGAEGTFSTTATPVILVTLLTAANIQPTTADITWTTDVPTTHVVEYDTSSVSYTYSTVESAVATTSHTVSLSGLTESTRYYYRVKNYSASLPDAVGGQSFLETTGITITHPTLAEKLRGIWMIGGLSGSSYPNVVGPVDLFDPVTGTWYPGVTTLPAAVSFAAAESYAGKIYVIGGFDSVGTAQSIVQIYDVALDSWSSGNVMLGARADIRAVVVSSKLYVLGGTTANATLAWAGSTTTYEYTPGGSWLAKLAYAAAHSERFSLAFNDVAYNFGGRSAAATLAATHDGYAATPNALTGGAEVVLTLARTGIAGVLYTPATGPAVMAIVGGFTTLTGALSCVVQGTTLSTPSNLFQYLYYPFTIPSGWASFTAAPIYPLSLGFASAALYGSTMYVFGGTFSVVASPTPQASGLTLVYSFDLSTPPGVSWTAAPAMPTGRYGHVAVTIRQ